MRARPNSSNDANLKGFTYNWGALAPTFDPNITNYTIDVGMDAAAITLTGIANNSNATVTGNVTNKELIQGDNIFDFTIVAEDGRTTKNYSVNVKRNPSSDATLSKIQYNAGSMTPEFNPEITDYIINVDEDVTQISIIGTATHKRATVSGNEYLLSLNTGINNVKITVTAEDELTTKDYNIIVNRTDPQLRDATLQNIVLNEGMLEPAFDAEITNYTVNIPNNIKTISVTGIPNIADATVEGNVTDTALISGSNIIDLTVTAIDDINKKTYTIDVIRAVSTDATLQEIEISEGTLTPSFDAETTEYTVEVENSVTQISISGIPNYEEATVEGNEENKQLNVGNNTVSLKVTAEDGISEKTYTVTIIRKISTDATLKEIFVSEGTLNPAFAAETTEYEVELDNSVDKISVSGTATHENATVSGNVTDKALTVGSNIITLEVTAEDNATKKSYTVNVIVREENFLTLINDNGVAIYPNPVSDFLFIQSDIAVQRISLFDITGSLIKDINYPIESIYVENLPNGLYLIKFETEKGVITHKISKL